MATKNLTLEKLQAALSYDPETGIFRRPNGKLAGCVIRTGKQPGYVVVGIDYITYRAARLAWLYVYGEMPSGDVDHVNRDPSDNRIANLRLATTSQNNFNRNIPRNNRSGVKGVFFYQKRNLWRSQIHVDGKNRVLGDFLTFDEAVSVRKLAEKEHFGVFSG